MERFCNTDQHVYRTGAIQSERLKRPYIPLGCEQQGQVKPTRDEPIPSEFAAHAASEYDDEPAPKPQMTTTDVVLLLLLWTMSIVVVVGLGAAVLPFVADFILWVRA